MIRLLILARAVCCAPIIVAFAGGTGHATPAPACPAIEESGLQRGGLPHLAAALKPGGTLNILALGSASMFDAQPSATADLAPALPRAAATQAPGATGFPWQMVQALQASVRALKINVSVVPTRGQAADTMLTRLRAELARQPAQLVLWQTGTVDAVDEVAPEDFYQALSDGAAASADAGADLVLIDPQYSRFLEANANMAPYLAALQEAATLPGVAVFNRFDIMHDWVESGALDLENTAKSDRPALAARLHSCLGRALARMLLGDGRAIE